MTDPAYRASISLTLALVRVEPERLGALRVPTLFVVGDEDIVFPPAAAVALASSMPNARVHRVPEAGHSVYFERAKEFNTLVSAFADSL